MPVVLARTGLPPALQSKCRGFRRQRRFCGSSRNPAAAAPSPHRRFNVLGGSRTGALAVIIVTRFAIPHQERQRAFGRRSSSNVGPVGRPPPGGGAGSSGLHVSCCSERPPFGRHVLRGRWHPEGRSARPRYQQFRHQDDLCLQPGFPRFRRESRASLIASREQNKRPSPTTGWRSQNPASKCGRCGGHRWHPRCSGSAVAARISYAVTGCLVVAIIANGLPRSLNPRIRESS